MITNLDTTDGGHAPYLPLILSSQTNTYIISQFEYMGNRRINTHDEIA